MTASSAEGICNLALDALGAEPITTISAPTKPNEKLLSRQYPHWRDAELRRHRWRFAIETVQLTPVGDPVPFGPEQTWYYFPWPTNGLRAVRRKGDLWKPASARRLLNPTTPLVVDFVLQRMPGDMDELFIEVLKARLAFECCEKITQSNEKKKDMWASYQSALAEAKLANAYEAGPEEWVEQDDNEQYTWEQARVL